MKAKTDLTAWWMSLAHMEENHPRALAALLKAPAKLVEILNGKARQYHQAMEQAREAYPDLDEDSLEELARPEMNPAWQDQRPLNREERKLLNQFKESHGTDLTM